MIVSWNVALMLGLAGISAAVLGVTSILSSASRRETVSRGWLVGLGLLFLASAVIAVGSQVITVVSKLSSGGGEDEFYDR